MTIFLMGLLCLVSNGELFSQHCLKMYYDRNGNRISFNVGECVKDWRGLADNDAEESVCDKTEDEVMLYPNPNNGRFRIELDNDTDDLVEMSVYDNKGVLVNSQKFTDVIDVDISSNPAGVYLLRISMNDDVRCVVVVKL